MSESSLAFSWLQVARVTMSFNLRAVRQTDTDTTMMDEGSQADILTCFINTEKLHVGLLSFLLHLSQ